MMEIELPDDVSTFRLMSAPIARLVAALPERRKFFSALLVWSGARIGTVNVSHAPRHAGSTHYGFTKLLNHTFDLIVGFSSKPLRYIGTLGFVLAVAGLGMGLWVIARKLLWDYGMMGWPSLFAAIVILGGMQLIATSVIGEYIARIYVQAQARPLYNVAERLNFDALQAEDELQRVSLASVATPPAGNREQANDPSSRGSAPAVVAGPDREQANDRRPPLAKGAT
jgi:polyisoprenyl-phosphate glycosyltransferase